MIVNFVKLMSYLCTMTYLDLTIVETYSLSSLGIVDISAYDTKSINNATLEVTVPGYNKVNVPFTPKSVNIYRATDLGIVCDNDIPLPDGLYTFKYSIQPNSTNYVEKSIFMVKNITAKLQNLYLENSDNCPCNKKKDKQIQEIRLLIEGSVSAANLCDIDTAYENYEKALKMINKLYDCKC